MNNSNTGGHQRLIEFEYEPENLDYFAQSLDMALKSINSDYEAKRSNSLTLRPPVIQKVQKGTFYAWLKSKGKAGGQNKIPRLSNDRKIVDKILELIK